MAAIAALEALKRPCTVDLHTDSQYLRNGITKWIHGWKRNGWRTADKKPVKKSICGSGSSGRRPPVEWHWVRAMPATTERARRLSSRATAIVEVRRCIRGDAVQGS